MLFIVASSIEGLPLRLCDSACEKILFGVFKIVGKSLTQSHKYAEIAASLLMFGGLLRYKRGGLRSSELT